MYSKEMRKSEGLTQKELSHLSSVAVSTIQNIEYGQIEPKESTVKLLVDVLIKIRRNKSMKQGNRIDLLSMSRASLIALLKERNPKVAKAQSNLVTNKGLRSLLMQEFLLTATEWELISDMEVTGPSEGSAK